MSEMKFECPFCKQHLECENDMAGTEVSCPGCNRSISIPCDQAHGDIPASQIPPVSVSPPAPTPKIKIQGKHQAQNTTPSDWKLPNTAALVFIAILTTLGLSGFLGLFFGYLIVAGLSFLVCRITKKRRLRIALTTAVVGVALIGFLVTNFVMVMRSEINEETERTILKVAEVDQRMRKLPKNEMPLSDIEQDRMTFLHTKAMSLVPESKKARLVDPLGNADQRPRQG